MYKDSTSQAAQINNYSEVDREPSADQQIINISMVPERRLSIYEVGNGSEL